MEKNLILNHDWTKFKFKLNIFLLNRNFTTILFQNFNLFILISMFFFYFQLTKIEEIKIQFIKNKASVFIHYFYHLKSFHNLKHKIDKNF